MRHGFVTVAAAVPSVRVADTDFNLRAIECQIARAEGMGVEVLCFPELSLTGYTCQDLFRSQLLVDKAEEALLQLLDFTRKLDVISIVGLPVAVGGLLLNCAAVVQKGSLLGIVPKTYLPNYNEFYEKRWFASSRDLRPTEVYLAGSSVVLSPDPKVFVTVDGTRFGIEICEDVWAPVPPSNNLALAGADIVFNLSASNELIGKHAYLKSLLAQQSARTISGYVYAGSGFGESTQDVVYGGNALVYENGALLGEGDRFSLEPQLLVAQVDVDRLRSERRSNTTFVNASRTAGATVVQAKPVEARDFMLLRDVEPWPFVPQGSDSEAALNEVLDIQTLGLAQRLAHTKCCQVVVGISGGLDSTLALLVCVRAFDRLKIDRRGIVGVTMPGTPARTHDNAVALMQSLGVSSREISIKASVERHFMDIGHDMGVHDVTYENSQARERTQILMDLANELGGFVVGTGPQRARPWVGHIQRRPHIYVRRQRRGTEDAHTPPREAHSHDGGRRDVARHLARHHRHAHQPGADTGRRAGQHKPEDREPGGPLRAPRLLPLLRRALRLPPSQDLHAGPPRLQRLAPRGRPL